MHQLRQILIALSAIAWAIAAPARAAEGDIPPIFELAPYLDLAPVLEEALWDASIAQDAPEGGKGLRATLAKLDATLQKDDDKAKPADLRALLEGYALLVHLERRKGEKAKDAVVTARRSLVQACDVYASKGESRYMKARAVYHGFATRLLLGEAPTDLAPLNAAIKDMSPELAAQAKLLVGLLEIEPGRAGDVEATVKRLALAAVQTPGAGAVAAYLSSARALAGIDAAGAVTGKTKPAYRDALAKAAQATDGLASMPAKRAAFAFATAVWQAAGGATLGWSTFPFKLAAYAGVKEVPAIQERLALAEARAGRYDAAVRGYEELARSGQPAVVARIDARIVDLRRDESVATKDSRAYEKTLLSFLDKYRKPEALGPKGRALVTPIRESLIRQFVKLATEVSDAAVAPGAKPEARARAAATLALLPKVTADAATKDAASTRIATIAALSGDHRAAVAGFLAQAKAPNMTPEKKRALLDQAAASQRLLAKWPETEPFAMLTKGASLEAAELDKLLEIDRLAAAVPAKGVDWPLAARIGVLQIVRGRPKDAEKLWRETLKKDGVGPEAVLAGGYLLTTLQAAKAWTDLETLARALVAATAKPVWAGKPVDPRQMLATALLAGGDEDLAAKRPAEAARRLAEYVKSFEDQPRQDEATLKLAAALRQIGKYAAALEVQASLVKKYPASPLSPKALRSAADDALRLALEQRATQLYEVFLKDYGKDEQAPLVQTALVRLYFAGKDYARAGALLKSMVESGRLVGPDLVAAGRQLVDVEARAGDLDRALAAATVFAKAAPTAPEAQIQLHLAHARKLATRRNFEKIAEIEAQLAKIEARSQDWEEALGEVRFMLAESVAGLFVLTVQSAVLASPWQTLPSHYAAFKETFRGYKGVCVGKTSFCAPALHRASRIAAQFLEAYRTARLPRTLDAKATAAYKKSWTEVQAGVVKMRDEAERGGLAHMASAYTDPTWAREILSAPSSKGWRSFLAYEDAKFYLQLDQKAAGKGGAKAAPKAKAKPKAGPQQMMRKLVPTALMLAALVVAAGCKTTTRAKTAAPLTPGVTALGKGALLVEVGTPGLLARLNAGEFKGAEAGARKTLRERPDDRAALTALTAALIQRGSFEMAEIYAEQLGTVKGGKADGLSLKAVAQYLGGRGDRAASSAAIDALQRAIKVDPNHVASRLDLAGIYFETGRTAAARDAYEGAISRCPQCTSAYLALATVHSVNADPKKAAVVLRQLLKREPAHFEALYALAVVYKDGLRAKDKAKACLDDILERAPASQKATRSKAAQLLKEL